MRASPTELAAAGVCQIAPGPGDALYRFVLDAGADHQGAVAAVSGWFPDHAVELHVIEVPEGQPPNVGVVVSEPST